MSLQTFAMQTHTVPSIPHSSTAEPHRDATNTARIATYARSKRRRSSIQIRVPSLMFTARHTGLATYKLAVESLFAIPSKSRVSTPKKYDNKSLWDALLQWTSGPCCTPTVRCVRSRPLRGWTGELDGQRRMAETAFRPSSVNSTPLTHPRALYREFRELALTASVYNIEQPIK